VSRAVTAAKKKDKTAFARGGQGLPLEDTKKGKWGQGKLHGAGGGNGEESIRAKGKRTWAKGPGCERGGGEKKNKKVIRGQSSLS